MGKTKQAEVEQAMKIMETTVLNPNLQTVGKPPLITPKIARMLAEKLVEKRELKAILKLETESLAAMEVKEVMGILPFLMATMVSAKN